MKRYYGKNQVKKLASECEKCGSVKNIGGWRVMFGTALELREVYCPKCDKTYYNFRLADTETARNGR